MNTCNELMSSVGLARCSWWMKVESKCVHGRSRFGRINGVQVAFCRKEMTLGAVRQCEKDNRYVEPLWIWKCLNFDSVTEGRFMLPFGLIKVGPTYERVPSREMIYENRDVYSFGKKRHKFLTHIFISYSFSLFTTISQKTQLYRTTS